MYTIYDENDDLIYTSSKQNEYIKKALQLYKNKYRKSLFDTEPKIINDKFNSQYGTLKCYILKTKNRTIFITI